MGHPSQETVQPSLKLRPSLMQYRLPTITPSPVQTPLTLWGALHVLSGMQLAIVTAGPEYSMVWFISDLYTI